MSETYVEICRFALPISVSLLAKVVRAVQPAYEKVGYSSVCMRGERMAGKEQLVLVAIPPNGERKQQVCLDTVHTRLQTLDTPLIGDSNV